MKDMEMDYKNLDLKECARSGEYSRNSDAITLGKRLIVDSVWKAAGIEGLGTTFPNTQSLIMNLPVQTTRDEMLFITNMKRGWEVVIGCIDFPNDLDFMKQLHRIITENLVYKPGEIRKTDVIISGTDWRPEIPCEETIISEIDRINKIGDKTDSAFEMFAFLTRAQIFTDGNKRMAELMSNKILMQYDRGILSVKYNDINRFLSKLISFYETGDKAEFKEYLKRECFLSV